MENILMKFAEKRESEIIFSKALIADTGRYLVSFYENKKIFIITNPLVKHLYGETLISGFSRYGIQGKFIEIPDGEEYKNLSTASGIYDSLLKGKADRNTLLVSFGGGVVGDITGFVASTYMRGIPYIHIPTTLLAQVDSSIGGKTAVDHPKAKNIIGSFYHPKAVFIDPSLIQTLPLEHIKNGLAEIIKIAVILSPSLFTNLNMVIPQILENNIEILSTIIREAVKLKAQLVLRDPDEKNQRKYLNYGHSIGHALEVIFGYQKIFHGEAIALGMVIETMISRYRGMCNADLEEKIKKIIKKLNIPLKIALKNINNERIWETVAFDKKNNQGSICFILPEKVGKVHIVEGINKREVIGALEEFKKEWL